MSVHGIRPRPAPVRGTAAKLLLVLRGNQNFCGPVSRLAELSGTGVNAVWRALEQLDYRRLVTAKGVGDGAVSVHVTALGRRWDLSGLSRR
jgi:hypothetical protein